MVLRLFQTRGSRDLRQGEGRPAPKPASCWNFGRCARQETTSSRFKPTVAASSGSRPRLGS